MTYELHRMDCLDWLELFAEDESIDAIVTDPPYGLGFMGKEWDDLPPGLPWARECLRVLKPGGHLLAFGGSRTWHRLAVAIEDAGFDIRDSIAWLYGSGFPKSVDVSKAIDKAAGATRPTYERAAFGGTFSDDNGTTYGTAIDNTPITPEAEQWQGWGTALKPAFEPIVVARKPIRGTVAANVLEHGTGALNIDGCRIKAAPGDYAHPGNSGIEDNTRVYGTFAHKNQSKPAEAGRWPANVVLDESQAAALDEQSGQLKGGAFPARRGGDSGTRQAYGEFAGQEGLAARKTDSGGVSRFFYVAKAPKKERPTVNGIAHPTVKPLALMRWLVRLVTPPGGTVLDPFAGSGTTMEAALLEGFDVIGIEREADYARLIEQRLS